MAQLGGLELHGQPGTVVRILERTRPPEEGSIPDAFRAAIAFDGKARVMLPPARYVIEWGSESTVVEIALDRDSDIVINL